jgi:hypothetical protein
MKKTVFIIMLLLTAVPGYALQSHVVILPDMEKPDDLKVDENQVYIVSGTRIHIYARTGFNLLKKFGKKGDGPGQLKPFRSVKKKISIDVHAHDIVITGNERLYFFSKTGEFKRQVKAPAQLDYFRPLGNGLACSNYYWKNYKKWSDEQILLMSLKGDTFSPSPSKKLYETKTGGGRRLRLRVDRKADYPLVRDYFGCRADNDKLYVADTAKGFFIAVFDNKGNKLGEIKRDYRKRKISEDFKNKKMAAFKENRMWKYKKNLNLLFPDYFPPFRNFWVSKGKIYTATYLEKGDENEIIFLDEKGAVLKKVFAPYAELACVYDSIYYYLKKNKDGEWELHSVQL